MAAFADTPAGMASEATRQVARAHAGDRYLAALLAPRAVRADLVTLAAFAGEVARIAHEVSEPMLGEIRLRWWHDAIAAGARGEATGHPVADALAAVVDRHDLARPPLLELLEAHALDLYDDPLPDTAALHAWLDKTDGTLFATALAIVGSGTLAPPDTILDGGRDAVHAAARDAGRAHGLARLLARLPRQLARRRLALPADRLMAKGFDPAEPVAPASLAAIAAVATELAAAARAGIATLRIDPLWLDRRTRTALLPLALVEPQLRGWERSGGDPPRDAVEPTPLARVWRLWRAHRFGAL